MSNTPDVETAPPPAAAKTNAMPGTSASTSEKRKFSPWVALVAVAASILITIAILAFGDKLAALQDLNYLGAFLIMLLGSATIILPAPAFVFVFALGSVPGLSPVLIGVAGGIGAALGEMSGYLAGLGGSAVFEDNAIFRRFDRWMDRYGLLAIFFLALIPNPLFDIAGMLAGASRIPVWQFLLACAGGKIVRCILLALGGYYGLNWVREVFA